MDIDHAADGTGNVPSNMHDPYADLRGFQPSGQGNAEPQSLGKVLSELIALKGLARVQGTQQLQQAWRSVAGNEITNNSAVIGLSRGVLQIGVSNTGLLSELASFHKHTLLENLQQQQPQLKIKELKFRLKTDVKS